MRTTGRSGRSIGIRHRTKKTAKGEARPTEVVIIEGDDLTSFKLEDEDAELDFVRGCLPSSWRDAGEEEDLSDYPPRHIRKKRGRSAEGAVQVPSSYEGLKADDTVAMILGGSGNYLAFALSRQAEKIGANVLRIPSFTLKEWRQGEKDADALTLVELAREVPELFYETQISDRNVIRVRECIFSLRDAMKERIACEQRLRQRVKNEVFLSDDFYPEGSIEAEFDARKASDTILAALRKEEKQREKELVTALGKVEIFTKILDAVEGCGPRIAARLIAAVGDIRRFETPAKLKAYLGVHVLADGRFPRRRRGEVANWNESLGRQALYLLADQWNRRPNSEWGQKLLQNKANLRDKHPEPEVVDGKKRYTNGHILRMAKWRTASRFVRWLWREWSRLEKRTRAREENMTREVAAHESPRMQTVVASAGA